MRDVSFPREWLVLRLRMEEMASSYEAETESTAVGIRRADHAKPSIRKS
jgi:hypothetical protein